MRFSIICYLLVIQIEFKWGEDRMKRQSNIELLRILAMVMIVGSHLAGHGVQQQLNPELAFKVWSMGSMLNRIVTVALIPGGG